MHFMVCDMKKIEYDEYYNTTGAELLDKIRKFGLYKAGCNLLSKRERWELLNGDVELAYEIAEYKLKHKKQNKVEKKVAIRKIIDNSKQKDNW